MKPDKKIRTTVCLDREVLDYLDWLRGPTPRSTYLNHLITQTRDIMEGIDSPLTAGGA